VAGEDLEITRRWVDAINGGDVETLLTLCDSEITRAFA